MRVETKPMYIADDGKPFEKEADCLAYEEAERKRAENTTYWQIFCGFDCTEGRGFGNGMLVELPFKNLAHEFMLDYCFKTFGSPICYVQGVSEAPNWRLTEINKEKFDKGMTVSIGDSRREAKRVKLTVEPGGRGSHNFVMTVVV